MSDALAKVELSRLFGAALDAAKSCVGIMDATGTLLLCNRAMASALLAGGAEARGGELLPQPSWEQYVAAPVTVQELSEDGQPTTYRIVVCDPPDPAHRQPARPSMLSDREWDIVQGLMMYRRLSEVAGALCISVHTARTHLKSVFRKMQVRSQSELLQLLLGTGNLPIPRTRRPAPAVLETR